MAMANSGSASLEGRLALISQMLEEAVTLLRNTMDEVKREESRGGDGDHSGTADRPR